MHNFLDTCILIAGFDKKDKFHKNSKEFLENKNNLMISVYQEKRELPYLFIRKEKIILEAIKTSLMPSYQPNLNKLTPKDIMILKRMIAKIKLDELSQQELFNLKKDALFLKQGVINFISNRIIKKVISLGDIDQLLVHKIKEQIKNEADANIISSAIQEHQENNLLIITLDINDWKKEVLIEAIKGTKYKKFPEIKYLF